MYTKIITKNQISQNILFFRLTVQYITRWKLINERSDNSINFFLVAFCLLIRMNKLIDSWILLSYTWIFIHTKYLFLNENIENLLYLFRLIRLITVLIGKLECSVTDLDKRDPTNIIFRPSVPSRSFLTLFPSSRACPFIMLATKINYIS